MIDYLYDSLEKGVPNAQEMPWVHTCMLTANIFSKKYMFTKSVQLRTEKHAVATPATIGKGKADSKKKFRLNAIPSLTILPTPDVGTRIRPIVQDFPLQGGNIPAIKSFL